MANDATGDTAATYHLTHANFETFTTSTYAMDAGWLASDTSANDPLFEIFECQGSVAYIFTCYKFQPREYLDYANETPTPVEIDGYPRFDVQSDEGTKNALAYFYDHDSTGTSGALVGGATTITAF